MTTKEKVIRQSITKIEKRLVEIQEILDFDWLKEFKALRNGFLSLPFEEQARTIRQQVKKEKKLERTFEKSMETPKLIEEKARLTLELADLNNELYWIENARSKAIDKLIELNNADKLK
jgi:predicted nucleotide-binding protein (sugar kinase/HSP70/actin superfamily)